MNGRQFAPNNEIRDIDQLHAALADCEARLRRREAVVAAKETMIERLRERILSQSTPEEVSSAPPAPTAGAIGRIKSAIFPRKKGG